MENAKYITINKNRGWRGLAELEVFTNDDELIQTNIFSFSPDMWDDLLQGIIVTKQEDTYYIIHFDNLDALPKPTQQRSVLIKNFKGNVTSVTEYIDSIGTVKMSEQYAVNHFVKNKNNHTQSDWNCVGIRVTPTI